ncbi:MAG: hypothetical protein WBE76_04900 [Terracidiphilus sp.]
MSKTVVQIVQDGSDRSAEPFQLAIVEGNTIEFHAQSGGGTILSLTQETASILTPKPASLALEIAGGASLSFQFLKPASLSYCCQVHAEGNRPGPIQCPPAQDIAVLTILPSHGRDPGDKTGRGL